MHRQAERDHAGLHGAFAERGVRVDGVGDVLERGFQGQRQHGLRNQVAGAGADDVYAQDFAVLAVSDDLDQAVGGAESLGPTQRGEREFARDHVVAGLARLALCQSDAGHLGMGERRSRHGLVVHLLVVAGDDTAATRP